MGVRWLPLFVLLAPVFCVADAKSEIQGIYATMSAAMHRKDPEGATKFLAEGFSAKFGGKVFTRADYLKYQRAMLPHVKSVDVKVTVTSLAVNGSSATALCDRSAKTVLTAPDGKVHTVESEEKRQDTWVKGSAGWRLKYFLVLKERALDNGQPMKPRGKQ